MLNWIKKNHFTVITTMWSLLIALFWLALRVNWSGISKALGADKNQSFFVMELPLLVCILLWILFVLNLVTLFVYKEKKWTKITSLVLSSIFSIVIIVVIALGAIDYLYFILPKFFSSLLISFALIIFAFLFFFLRQKNVNFV